MKQAVSISLGSSKRDHVGVIQLGNESIEMVREGVDGDVKKMIQRYKDLDGTVDAFGAGGFMFGFHVGERFYPLRTSNNITKHIKTTPIADGDGVKKTIERYCLQTLSDQIEDLFEDKPRTALVTAAIDRYSMAWSIIDAGFESFYGDFIFGLGIKFGVRSIKSVHRLARVFLPILRQAPMSWLYPTGSSQDTNSPHKYRKYFEPATLIAGDFIYTKKYAPMDMDGKIILTNTTTSEDIKDFKERGVSAIITTTPEVQGRTFGTNALEAAIVAHAELGRILSHEEMIEMVDKLGLKPNVIRF